MKIQMVGARLFHVDAWTDGWTDGQTDMTKLLVTSHNYANVPKTKTHFNFLCVSCLL